jgi:hypothetical protein
MPSAGFELGVPSSELSHVQALDRATTGIGDQALHCNVAVYIVCRCVLYSTQQAAFLWNQY